MAIYGAGSNWGGKEMKNIFINEEKFVVGWNYKNAQDIYNAVSVIKPGDIIYLKSNKVGSRRIRVKAVGLVTKTFIQNFFEHDVTKEEMANWQGLSIDVRWVIKSEFLIEIPINEGKLTNVRAATFYEENMPSVQTRIIEELLKQR